MARYVDKGHSRAEIDKTIVEWKQRCLLESGSLVFDDRAIWTIPNLQDFQDRLIVNPVHGADQNFGEKLAGQLETASDDVRWLAAELLIVYFLFARGAVNGPSKRASLDAVVAPLGPDFPARWTELRTTMSEGIANPGPGYNITRNQQVGYLIDFCLRFKAVPEADQRTALLEDPWKMRDFADATSDGVTVREMRHILLHLLFPDEYERISSGTHKRNIVNAFATEFLVDDDSPEDLDEQLLRIREHLVALNAQPVELGILDFYWPPLRRLWDSDSADSDGSSDLDLLLYKKQMVLYGAPGTGKTHHTRQLADQLIRRVAVQKWGAKQYFASQDELDHYVTTHVRWVQLHPGYGYEEFVRGLRLAPDGSTVYVDGLLPRLCSEILDVPETDRLPVVLVLDEINRTDLTRMFGEAFSLLENRDTSLTLPGINADDEPAELTLPDNLFVIGTMNLIDQSIEELDFALRRRFFWRPAAFDAAAIVAVNEERWPKHAPSKWGWQRAVDDMTKLADRAELLNEAIATSPHLGEQYILGHTYYFDAAFFAGNWLRGRKSLSGGVFWMKSGKPRPPLIDLWTLSLEPLLTQYLAGLEADFAAAERERLRKVFLSGAVT